MKDSILFCIGDHVKFKDCSTVFVITHFLLDKKFKIYKIFLKAVNSDLRIEAYIKESVWVKRINPSHCMPRSIGDYIFNPIKSIREYLKPCAWDSYMIDSKIQYNKPIEFIHTKTTNPCPLL